MFSDLKPWAYATILASIISATSAVWFAGKESGYNERVAEEAGLTNDRITTLQAEFKIKLGKANERAKDFEGKLIKLQTEKTKEVTVYVEKVVTRNPDCTRLDGFSELWNGIRANYHPSGKNNN